MFFCVLIYHYIVLILISHYEIKINEEIPVEEISVSLPLCLFCYFLDVSHRDFT